MAEPSTSPVAVNEVSSVDKSDSEDEMASNDLPGLVSKRLTDKLSKKPKTKL